MGVEAAMAYGMGFATNSMNIPALVGKVRQSFMKILSCNSLVLKSTRARPNYYKFYTKCTLSREIPVRNVWVSISHEALYQLDGS